MFPVFFENSRVPVWLSNVAPIEIWAINIGVLIFCKGELSDTEKNHEIIHYKQTVELLFVGFWVLYFMFWVWGLLIYRNGAKAYRMIPFEKEAYSNEGDLDYLKKRKLYSWVKYVRRQRS